MINFSRIKKTAVSFFAMSALIVCSMGSAGATTLGLVIDGSGSIGNTNFNTQRTAYVNALNNVIDSNYYGNLAIGVWQFSGGVSQIIGYTTINNASDLALVTSAINGMTYTGGLTNISGAINAASAAANLFGPGVNDDLVIDVSTDGYHNQGGLTPLAASQQAVTTGLLAGFTDVQVNSLLIGNNAQNGWHYGGPVDNSFEVYAAANFSNLQSILEGKLTQELGGDPVPEPSTMILLGSGLIGLVGYRRKKQA